MATQPDPHPDGIPAPDTIEPRSPPEIAPPFSPDETPVREAPEIVPEGPDYDEPDRSPPEIPEI
jgi:hypothetical protein